ncbi:hypothetical protein NM688_g9114 [Phlebia brevispora]|uniref:Uncharacterized protein n=1 Tax=Phlebia brevispora TaxID=194682 RepID=A0ACC1RL48_9APHY|nr:hypothetical protein NM688_g9114 [Phlebia brevispora]
MSSNSISIASPSNLAGTSENTSSAPCGICRRQFSKYTCPKCNLPYCSLTCFRSPAHAECSEGFYRKELENDIHSAPSKSADERRQMLELLKRFEEGTNDDPDLLGGDSSDSDNEDDLENRLASVDLNSASYDDIWTALTPPERDRFLKALNDPSGELAQQLLASEELESQIVEPWWLQQTDDEESAQPAVLGLSRRIRRFGDKPKFVHIPPAARKAAESVGTSGPSLLYNICAVLLAYAYITRYLSTSPLSVLRPGDSDHEESHKLFSRLVPFLTDRKSKTVLPSLSAIITDLWSRFEPNTMTPAHTSFTLRRRQPDG